MIEDILCILSYVILAVGAFLILRANNRRYEKIIERKEERIKELMEVAGKNYAHHYEDWRREQFSS